MKNKEEQRKFGKRIHFNISNIPYTTKTKFEKSTIKSICGKIPKKTS